MRTAITTIAALTLAAPALAGAIVPFTETFDNDSANWRDAAGAPLDWIPSGSFDGSAYASGGFNFANSVAGDTPVIFRAQNEFDSSGGAFVGDWIASGVTQFSAWVRHDAPAPLGFFVRFAGPANFPGAIGVEFTPVAPGGWTQISIDIDPDNPQFISFSGSDFDTIFSNIGNVQIGVTVPEGLAGLDQGFTFDLDNASIIPSPGAATLLALAGAASLRRRR